MAPLPTCDSSTTTFTVLPEITKGDADWREYHSIELPNGVKCVFVHDKESKTTACSVCVGAGASADPRELSGLAHFTEHMCFLGSEAYPGENEFKKYLSSHGGRSNASTSMSQTVYKFDILADHAEKAIDIFSNFFISPLFTISGTSRELNAVDSENSKNMSNDGRRRLQILKSLANPTHHYSKFSTGNAKTLAMNNTEDGDSIENDDNKKGNNPLSGVDLETSEAKDSFVREALLAFHRRHYRPDNFVVVVVGPQSIETQQKWIVPRFAAIVDRWDDRDTDMDKDKDESKNENEKMLSKAETLVNASSKDAPMDSFGSPPVSHDPPFDSKFQSNTWPIMLTTLPLQSVRKMYIYVPLPSVKEFHDQSPYNLISHLLGHEGPGSCFAFCQDAELIDMISVGPRLSEVDHSLLQISISLTEKGEEQWEDVVSVIFDYCHLMYDTVKKAKKYLDNIETNDNDTHDKLELEDAYKKITRIWEEIQKVRSLRFHQTSPGHAYSLAPFLAGSVRKNGTSRSMCIGSMLNEHKETFPVDTVLDFLERIVPQNCFIERCSQTAWEEQKESEETPKNNQQLSSSSLFGFRKETWYGVDYHLSPISQDISERWNWKEKAKWDSSLCLPLENEYIPTDLSLCPDLPEEATKMPRIEKEIEPPNLLIQDIDFGRLWHRLDDRYCLPKASLTILFRNAAVNHKWDDETAWSFDSDAGIQSSILMDTFSDALAQTTYDASLAGLKWYLTKTDSGLVLKCNGYSQHLTSFTHHILEQFFDAEAPFIREKHVRTNKDRMIRHLQSYLTSKRADSYASYYSNLLLSSRGLGVEDSLRLAKKVSTESIRAHHQSLIRSGLTKVECLISGNISKDSAKVFFDRARQTMTNPNLTPKHNMQFSVDKRNEYYGFIPGPFERALKYGEDIHLHFQSQNPEEQNGAVRMTFQSPINGFKGLDISSPFTKESLLQTAAVRVLCHMLREPLFNQSRTKEQLGYIVNSHYDLNFSSQSGASDQTQLCVKSFATIPINSVVVNVLSRKAPPPVITQRIDEFLESFREKLLKISDKELLNHKDALSRKLVKPIQSLESEVSEHFSKIKRFGPEILDLKKSDENNASLPWDTKKHLSTAIAELKREDIIKSWDSIVGGPRIVSHIYGSSYKIGSGPTNHVSFSAKDKVGKNIVHIDSTTNLFERRNLLLPYGKNRNIGVNGLKTIMKQIGQRKIAVAGVAAGTGLLLYAFNTIWGGRRQGSSKEAARLSIKVEK